jgi:hypothetical protein
LQSNDCIIPVDSPIGQALRDAARDRRFIFVAGLPSSGKSLLLQQLTILANQVGRSVHSLQWDSARQAFETERALAKYPEIDGLTHPGIRKAVGLWVREAISAWHTRHSSSEDILIAELPVVGGRFVELLRPEEDDAESLLNGTETVFFVPVPTLEMRNQITAMRAETFANPRNEKETKDAPPHIVDEEWVSACQLYNAWNGLPNNHKTDVQYDPAIYRSVFQRLARYRNLKLLVIDQKFETKGSAYERPVRVEELLATEEAVKAAFAKLEELYPGKATQRAIDGWDDY